MPDNRTYTTASSLRIIKAILLTTIVSCFVFLSQACRRDPKIISDYHGFPKDVGDIILNKCATAGCHNDASKDAAAGLSLSSWDKLFEGGRAGAAVIPYRTDQSFLLFFINTYADLGLSQSPSMPANQPALSREEVLTMKKWIANGAPDDQGFVKFSDNPQRKKIYVLNSKCKLVSVFDKETGLIMRYVDVGTEEDGVLCMIKVAPDNNYWYALFTAENGKSALKKYSADNDRLVASMPLNNSLWKTMKISSDAKRAIIADTKGNSSFLGGSITLVDLSKMSVLDTYGAPNDSLFFPMGIETTKNFSLAYSPSFHSNYLHKIDLTTGNVRKIRLDPALPPIVDDVDDSYNPVQVLLSQDESKYFVLCARSHEVRVFQRSNDSLIAQIDVGGNPLEMKLSEQFNYLFVSDTGSVTFKQGIVHVVDCKKFSYVKSIYTGNQPQGLEVDHERNLVYVANRNVGGGAHHESSCQGNPGYVTLIDMNTLQLIPQFKTEVSVEPISVSIRY